MKGESKRGTSMELFPLECTLCRCVSAENKNEVPVKPYKFSEEPRVVARPSKDQILFVTVATHREPYIDLLEQSAKKHGIDMQVIGMGEFFKGVI